MQLTEAPSAWPRDGRARGISLIEALVALAVLAFGLTTLAGLQLSWARHADVARQRTEATRLAQQRLEELRAFEQLEPSEGKAAWADMRAGADRPDNGSNTRFERRWALSGSADDPLRLVSVDVRWVDRDGSVDTTAVQLQSAIARVDPADAASLALPPRPDDPMRRRLGRSNQVPVEALASGERNRTRSTLPWNGPRAGHLVFDDLAGTVTARCAEAPDGTTDIASRCQAIDGYLLSGFIGGVPAGTVPSLSFDRLRDVADGSLPECALSPTADARGDAATGLWRYRCLIQPGDSDHDPATPKIWSGRVRVASLPAGVAACRYGPATDAASNLQHPETYARVDRSLDHQNFVLTVAETCPAGSTAQAPD